MKHYLFLAVFFLIVSCNSDTLKKEVELYKNGKTKRMYYLDKEGNRQGKAVLYYENGKIEDIIYFKDDLLDGNFYAYDENGVLRNKGKYKDNIQIDTTYFYDEKGKLESYIVSNENSEELKEVLFFPHGKIKKIKTYFIGTGEANAFKSYTEDGKLLPEYSLSKFLTINKNDDSSLLFNLYGKWTETPDSIVINVVYNFNDDDTFPKVLRKAKYINDEPLKFKIMNSDYINDQLFLYIEVYGVLDGFIHSQLFHFQLKRGEEIPKDNVYPMSQ